MGSQRMQRGGKSNYKPAVEGLSTYFLRTFTVSGKRRAWSESDWLAGLPDKSAIP
jgi:hypothetical protein